MSRSFHHRLSQASVHIEADLIAPQHFMKYTMHYAASIAYLMRIKWGTVSSVISISIGIHSSDQDAVPSQCVLKPGLHRCSVSSYHWQSISASRIVLCSLFIFNLCCSLFKLSCRGLFVSHIVTVRPFFSFDIHYRRVCVNYHPACKFRDRC